MQTLEVTETQYAYIAQVREELAGAVGRYGHVRNQDAVQFLIDQYEGDVDISLDVERVVGDDGAREEPGGEDGNEDSAGDGTDHDDDSTDSADEDDDSVEEDDDSVEEDDGSAVTFEESDVDEPTEEDDSGDGEMADAIDDDGNAGDDDMLERMMNLLDTHDDKWEESPSGDHRYRVTLPDGTTEDVQTKDDVRALLFKHY